MAQKAPAQVSIWMTNFITGIVRIVHDERLQIRETAAEALNICLEMMEKRPTRFILDRQDEEALSFFFLCGGGIIFC